MNQKIKNICITILFVSFLTVIGVLNLLLPDQDISSFERRRLDQVPSGTWTSLLSEDIFTEYEEYFLDQFVARDQFRALTALSKYYLLGLKDNNDIYLYKDKVYKIEYPLRESSIQSAAQKFNMISEKYLKDLNLYYSIIPDKNYFGAKPSGHLSMDYDNLLKLYKTNMDQMQYIDLLSLLEDDDYYSTDLHWKQENLLPVAKKLQSAMKSLSHDVLGYYNQKEYTPFYGAYYGHSALPVRPDVLTYLSNDTINKAKFYDHLTKTYHPVYTTEELQSIDSYNVFLGGPKALLTVENPQNKSGKHLYLFRDSYSSSLAPLLLESYSKITLIDLRYIKASMLTDYITFEKGADALFLYGIQVLNQSAMLRVE